MPRPGPRRQFVGARMSDEQIRALDAIAEREGVDRSEIVRRAVDAYVGADLDAAREFARWELGDADWADLIVRAYLDPARARGVGHAE